MNRENSGLLIGFVIMVALPLASLAGLRAIEKHEGHQLLVGATVNNYATHEACVAAAKAAGVGAYKCKDVTSVTVEATCDDEPMPPLPKGTEAWAVQVSDTEWRTEVTAWVAMPPPACWALGRGELVYTDNEAEAGAPDLAPGPWVYGVDYPVGTACPAAALAGCYIPPHPDVPPPVAP